VSEIPFSQKKCSNQCLDGSNSLEFEKDDEKIERKLFANYFSTLFPKDFLLLCRLKIGC